MPVDLAPLDPRSRIAVGYHERTKHHEHRFAASLGYLDWDSQPDPFRAWEGAPSIALPHPDPEATLAYPRLFGPPALAPAPLGLDALGRFLGLSLALSAWKVFGNARWSLRVNPSSGNLHPTEAYLLLPALPALGDRPGLLHYAPRTHALERRAAADPGAWARLGTDARAPRFLVGLSSIPWRESWKYGERAWRYCQHDVGHALGALRLAAATCGWALRVADEVDAPTAARLLGLDRTDEQREHEVEVPDLLAWVGTALDEAPALGPAARAALAQAQWSGRANALSEEHHAWDVISVVEEATRATGRAASGGRATADGREDAGARAPSADRDDRAEPPREESPAPRARAGAARPPGDGDEADDDSGQADVPAGRLILQRRSAVAMDGRTRISRARFLDMLARVLPDRTRCPWDALPWRPRTHLLLFVHRVDDVEPGMYLLVRHGDADALRVRVRPDASWTPVADGLPLFLLRAGDARATATRVSCGQDIAGQGAFSLGMVCELHDALLARGAHAYRELHWEAGLVGQVLYLEAEAAGVRSTGIGCFFDDAVHAVLGVRDLSLQTLYHFTVGGAVEDERLTTEPGYRAT